MSLPSPTSRSGRRIYLSVWDLFWAATTPILALYLRDVSILLRDDWTVIGLYWAISTGCAVVAFFAFRLQDGMTRYFSLHEAIDVTEAVLFAELMGFLALFTLTRLDGIPRSIPLTHGLLLLAGLLGARIGLRLMFAEDEPAHHAILRRERIIVIGANPLAAGFIRLLESFVPQRQSVIAILDGGPDAIGKAIAGVKVVGTSNELDTIVSEFIIHGVVVDRVVIAGEANLLTQRVQHEIERVCRERKLRLSFLPRLLGITEVAPPAVAAAITPRLPTNIEAAPAYFRLKRLLDFMVASGLLVLLSPIFMLAGLLVLIDVGRPLHFWQERLGWKGRSFLIYKFRTLHSPFDDAGNPSEQGRTPSAIGRFLRATRFDELPQLFNVLIGDMSLIGPRPLLPEDQPANVAVRLSVRPGITGWAQLNGGKLVSPEEKEKFDEWYVHNASFGLDLRIVRMTLALLARTRLSSPESQADTVQAQTKNRDVAKVANAPSLVAPEPAKSMRLHHPG